MTATEDRRYRILHLSDTHVGANGVDDDGVDALGALHGLLVDVAHVPNVDLVLVTGDVADDGSAQGQLRQGLELLNPIRSPRKSDLPDPLVRSPWCG